MLDSIFNGSCFLTGMTGGSGHWGAGGHMMGSAYGGFSMMIMWLIFVVLIAVAVYVAVRLATSWTPAQGEEAEDALAILKKRYARGEIDEEEYEKRREKLSS